MTKLGKKTHVCKKIPHFILYCLKFALPLHPQLGTSPHMVRWMSGLVNGLQNRVHPFESGTHLQTKKTQPFKLSLFCFVEMGGKNILCKVQFSPSPQNEKAQPKLCHFVEMEGIEPSSKQGSHTLSTCLFLPLVFVIQQDQDHQLYPYPLKFHWQHEATVNYS